MTTRQTLGGCLLLAMLVLGVAAEPLTLPRWPAGLCAWTALALLLRELPPHQRGPCLTLAAIGLCAGGLALFRGHAIEFTAVAGLNLDILVLLAGTSFLRLLCSPAGSLHTPARGRRAFASTLLGVHLFSMAINLPAMLIAGDHMQRGGRLSRMQELLLSRAFSAAAFWSPFFAAMAVAIGHAPGAELHVLVLYGLPPAMAALLAMLALPGRAPDVERFEGYPPRLEALRVPATLALCILVLHALLPTAGIVPLIAAAAFLLAMRAGPARAARHVRERLPRMCGELALFLAAGVLSLGLRTLMLSLPALPRPEEADVPMLALLLLAMLCAARLGVHPVISIAVAAALLEGVRYDPNLIGCLYLGCWALGVAISPYSGTHLALHARYGSGLHALARANLGYVAVMYAFMVAWLAWLRGLSG